MFTDARAIHKEGFRTFDEREQFIRELTEEIETGLWQAWRHSLYTKLDMTPETISIMIKVLISEYWAMVDRGFMQDADGQRHLLDVFSNINNFICYRMMHEARYAAPLFTPHLVDRYHKVWSEPSKVMGLPPNP
jgi:hypothetical protein